MYLVEKSFRDNWASHWCPVASSFAVAEIYVNGLSTSNLFLHRYSWNLRQILHFKTPVCNLTAKQSMLGSWYYIYSHLLKGKSFCVQLIVSYFCLFNTFLHIFWHCWQVFDGFWCRFEKFTWIQNPINPWSPFFKLSKLLSSQRSPFNHTFLITTTTHLLLKLLLQLLGVTWNVYEEHANENKLHKLLLTCYYNYCQSPTNYGQGKC